jgi:hypothetical protein
MQQTAHQETCLMTKSPDDAYSRRWAAHLLLEAFQVIAPRLQINEHAAQLLDVLSQSRKLV